MNNVHPLFQGILHPFRPAEPTEADKARALELALDPREEMNTGMRFRIIGQYGTAEDLAAFAEKLIMLDAAHASACT